MSIDRIIFRLILAGVVYLCTLSGLAAVWLVPAEWGLIAKFVISLISASPYVFLALATVYVRDTSP